MLKIEDHVIVDLFLYCHECSNEWTQVIVGGRLNIDVRLPCPRCGHNQLGILSVQTRLSIAVTGMSIMIDPNIEPK